jgi:hypothetical protein
LKENRKEEEEVEEEEVEEEEGCKRKSFSPTTTVISEVQQIREIRNLHVHSCLVDMEMQAL